MRTISPQTSKTAVPKAKANEETRTPAPSRPRNSHQQNSERASLTANSLPINIRRFSRE
jgi:hypothetical protein